MGFNWSWGEPPARLKKEVGDSVHSLAGTVGADGPAVAERGEAKESSNPTGTPELSGPKERNLSLYCMPRSSKRS